MSDNAQRRLQSILNNPNQLTFTSYIYIYIYCSKEIQKRCEAIVKIVEKEIQDLRKQEEERALKEKERLQEEAATARNNVGESQTVPQTT